MSESERNIDRKRKREREAKTGRKCNNVCAVGDKFLVLFKLTSDSGASVGSFSYAEAVLCMLMSA